jgi:hypothetical protein
MSLADMTILPMSRPMQAVPVIGLFFFDFAHASRSGFADQQNKTTLSMTQRSKGARGSLANSRSWPHDKKQSSG